VQLRCALLKAHQVEAPRAKDNKGQRQHNRHLAEGRQRGWDGGMMREQPGSQQDPKIHTQKRKCKKCAWHPPQAQNGQSK
jgi:hypothetical protein